jgi:hypothetical protein
LACAARDLAKRAAAKLATHSCQDLLPTIRIETQCLAVRVVVRNVRVDESDVRSDVDPSLTSPPTRCLMDALDGDAR